MIEHLFDRLLSFVKELKYAYLRLRIKFKIKKGVVSTLNSGKAGQDLQIYSEQRFADEVSNWGSGTVWNEIQYLLANCNGKILDMGCGTCKVFSLLEKFSQCDIYGCDISKFLIERAIANGVSNSKLIVCDATKTPYDDDEFDYSYSIGSLEHFTEAGVMDFLKESCRITKHGSFHQVPVSRCNKDDGWIKLGQSYFNNSIAWWLEKIKKVYPKVYVLNSLWEDPISLGKWFVCLK